MRSSRDRRARRACPSSALTDLRRFVVAADRRRANLAPRNSVALSESRVSGRVEGAHPLGIPAAMSGRMELTGRRRLIHTTLFATVAWAGYLILFMWSWSGAGNGASIVLGSATVIFTARAMHRPTVRRALQSTWLLLSLLPVIAIDRTLHLIFANYSPDYIPYEIPADATRVAIAIVAVSGFALLFAIRRLAALEQLTRERVCAAI